MTIERLRELHDHASSEPWRVSTEDRARILWSSGGYLGSMRNTTHPDAENAALVVAMRNALPALLDVAEAARQDHLDRHANSSMDASACTAPACVRIRAALAALDKLP